MSAAMMDKEMNRTLLIIFLRFLEKRLLFLNFDDSWGLSW